MSYIPPSGRFNATISGNTAGVGSLVSAGTLSFAGGNNITLSQNGNAITISGANAPSGSINFSAGTTSGNLASLTFSNSNGVGFGLNGGVITASHNGLTSQSNQALSASNGSFAFQTAAFSNANGVTFGTSAGSIMTASVNTSYAASNHSHGNPTLALTNISGTTASASNGLTLSLSAAAPGAGVVLSGAGGSITSGTASISAGGALSASFNGQTLSLNAPIQSNLSATGAVSISNNGNTISIGAPIQTNQTMGFYAAGNTTQNSSTTFDARSLTFNGLGNVSVGYSNGSVQISGSGGGGGLALANSQTTYSTGTASLLEGSGAITIGSGTGQRFNISVPQASSISATGAVSISVNGNTISIGAPSQSMQTQGVQTINLGGNTSGAMASISSGALSLFGGNNITLSQNANSVTISGGAGGGGGGVALSAPGGSISSGTASISAGGALTASVNGQTLSLNAPATSMLSAGDGISISTIGSTVVFQAATGGGGGGSSGGAGSIARWEYPTQAFNSIGVMVSNSLSMQHIPIAFNVTGSAARLAISLNLASLSNTGTTGSVAATLNVGLYTRSGSTLSSVASGSAATSFSYSSGNYVTSIYHGVRELTAPLAASITPGDYWIGAIVRTAATSGTIAINVMGLGTAAGMHNSGSIGVMGSAIGAVARDVFMGNGMYATTAIPSSLPFTGINNTAVSNLARANFYHAIYSATF